MNISEEKEDFENLIRLHIKGAVAFATRYLKDEHMAEDIAQDAFAYYFVNRDKYNSKYSFKTYLYTIIKNKSIDYIRKNSRMSYVDSIDETSCQYERDTYSGSPETIHMKKQQSEDIRKCLDELKDEYREVIYLYEYEELSYKEIAKIIDKSTASVKITLFRARRKLKDIYGQIIELGENI